MESQKQEGAFQTSVAKRWNNVAVKFQQSLIEQEIKKKLTESGNTLNMA